eukprot:TRINITY_DN5646_c0_g1_i1.p1 TRINITY_DN5646_c0_g1~~TRINITY_DN5646_c0_g1_i1.p1  ORF type:complete len:136 (-),score=26.03 TRINITY_DN5646_c0_g1_i1:109-516(-)
MYDNNPDIDFDKPLCFDSRIFNLESNLDILENIHARQSDCIRNSIHTLARVNHSTTELDMASRAMQLELIKNKGGDWESMPPWFKYGTFMKRKLVTKKKINEYDGKEIEYERKLWYTFHDLLENIDEDWALQKIV